MNVEKWRAPPFRHMLLGFKNFQHGQRPAASQVSEMFLVPNLRLLIKECSCLRLPLFYSPPNSSDGPSSLNKKGDQ